MAVPKDVMVPGSTASAHTINFYTVNRINANVGNYGSNHIAALALVFPNGWNDGLPAQYCRDLIVDFLMNQNVGLLWRPNVGDLRENVRNVLNENLDFGREKTTYRLFINGQHGNAYVA